MKKYWTLLFAVGVGMLPASRLVAHPYASGITNNNGTIYWILNESATDVKIQYDNNSVVNDLGSAPSVGTNSFALGSHTNYSCLLYTSDAADDLLCVDLGGRRII